MYMYILAIEKSNILFEFPVWKITFCSFIKLYFNFFFYLKLNDSMYHSFPFLLISNFVCFVEDQETGFKEADIARSLLLSISNDIGQIAYLHAKLHGLNKIYFGGYFIRGHPLTMHTITYAINFWSKVSLCVFNLSE